MARSPTLRPFIVPLDFARVNGLAYRSLFVEAPDTAPVVVLLEGDEAVDDERLQTLGLDRREAFLQSIEALEEQEDAEGASAEAWARESIAVKGGLVLEIVGRAGDGASAEEILVPAVMSRASLSLGGGAIAVAMPARGVLFATLADQKWQLVAAFGAAARLQYEAAGEQALWAGLLRVEEGRPTGVIELGTMSLEAAAAKLRN